MESIELTTKQTVINGNILSEFDLRIGNIVYVDNEKYHAEIKNVPMVVKSISRNYWHGEGYILYCELDKLIPEKYNWKSYAQNIEFLKPIEISKEWLLKFGFVEQSPLGQRTFFAYGNLTVELCAENQNAFYFNGTLLCFHKYIHNLQNIVYSLFGVELNCA